MSLVINSPELEGKLEREAAKRGIPAADFAVTILYSHLEPQGSATIPQSAAETAVVGPKLTEQQRQSIAAIQSLDEIGSEEEQKDTFAFLKHAIDEDRLSDRKLFA